MDNIGNKFMVLEGEVGDGQFITWAYRMTENEAFDFMKQKIRKDKKKYIVVEVKHTSNEYKLGFKDDCDREIHLREEKIKELQYEIRDLKQTKELVD